MSDVLSKVKILEDLIKTGREDEVISKTIDKLTLYKLDTLKKDLEDIENKIFILEKKYKMDSGQFLQRFEQGKMEDDIDYLEWSSLLDMKDRITQRLKTFEGALE
jgi:hypothetical protein